MSSTPRTRRAPIALTGAALAAALGASLTFSLPASADLGDQKAKVGKQLAATRDKLDAAKDDLADTSAALKAAYADVSATRGRLPAAQNAVALARTNAALAQQRNQQAIADLALAKAAEAEAASDLADTTTKLTRTRSQVAGFAAQMYQEQGLGSLAAQFSATDAQDLADRMSMADNVADIQAQALSTLSASAADLAGKQARLTATRRQVADAQAATAVAAASAQAAQVQAEQAQAEAQVAPGHPAGGRGLIGPGVGQGEGPPRRPDGPIRRPAGEARRDCPPAEGGGRCRRGGGSRSPESRLRDQRFTVDQQSATDLGRLPVRSVVRLDLFGVRDALASDPSLLAPAQRP